MRKMINDLRYTVRSREIVDLVAAMRNGSIVLSPYFQRNLVWRDAHKRDFIDTILKGYPFPQIFLARGPIDVDAMSAIQAVVDGQQRLNTIREFVSGGLDIDGRFFRDLTNKEKEEFLKYEVAVIDFDLESGDPRLKDVFHRLNRTYYSLSAIERLASEYSASEFMLIARLLCGEITNKKDIFDDGFISSNDLSNGSDYNNGGDNFFSRDPGIDDENWQWLLRRADGEFSELIRSSPVFTSFEYDRKVPLMFTLNVMCTYLIGYYERNDKVRKMLDEYTSVFPERQDVLNVLNETALFIKQMKIPNDSLWWNKANFFTIVSEISRVKDIRLQRPEEAWEKLFAFGESLPADYALAAKEAVSRKPQRELRGVQVRKVLMRTS